MRREERSAESTIALFLLARRPRGEACSSSRLARTLVSGVRSSCEASATNSRCLRHRRLALGARRVELAQHLLERAGQLPDLVVDLGVGHWRDGSPVAAIWRAVAVSAEIGRIARLAIATPARLASRVPPRMPATMKSQSRSTVESTWAMLRPYWT